MRLWLCALLIASLSIPLAGCTPPGMLIGMGSKTKHNVTEDTLVLKSRPSNFVDAVSDIGKSLKYDMAGVNRSQNEVRFTDNSGMLTTMLVGKNHNVSLIVKLLPNGRTVALQIVVAGNLSSAKQETVEKRLEEFKAAIRSKFG